MADGITPAAPQRRLSTQHHLADLRARLQPHLAEPLQYAALEKAARTYPYILEVDAEILAGNVIDTAACLNITASDYLSAVLGRPRLFTNPAVNISAKIDSLAELTHIPRAACIAAALRSSSLFYHDPATVAANVRDTARLIGLRAEVYREAVLKQPWLMTFKPATIAANIARITSLLEVDRTRYVKAAPHLFYMRATTIAANSAWHS